MISPKQQKILAFPYSKYDALICDGAVRSGKTSIMMWAFVRWAMENFSGQRFGVCGRTVDSCTKNIIVPFTAMSLAKENYIICWRRGDKVMEVRRGAVTNYFEVFGGKDEGSAALIQGLYADSRKNVSWRASGRSGAYATLFCGTGACTMLCGRREAVVLL